MAEQDNNIYNMVLADAIEKMAMRPQKTSTRTFTTSTSTPRALEDMIMRREIIGANNQRLLDALKNRESFRYNFGAGLANIAPRQGSGTWVSDFARAFGGAMNRPTDAQIAREQAAQELAQKDLETALEYDKAMGETQAQTQDQTIGYTAPIGSKEENDRVMGQQQANAETAMDSLADVYRTVANNELLFSNLAPVYQDENSRALKQTIQSQGIEKLGHNEFEYLNSIMPKGFATAVNTAAEQKMMRPYTAQFTEGTGTAKISAIKNMVGSIYDLFAADAKKQGYDMPISRQEYINSRLEKGREYNPAYFTGKSTNMYKTNKQEQGKQDIVLPKGIYFVD